AYYCIFYSDPVDELSRLNNKNPTNRSFNLAYCEPVGRIEHLT
ncbi:unnamed protein product, partial [marine sediment metagenome]